MTQKTNLFDWIAEGINSLGAVLIAMLSTIGGMIFFSHTLFSHVFPDSMTTWERWTASWLAALGWELTVLIATVNHKHIPKWIPRILAICSGVIVLFFINVLEPGIGYEQTIKRVFVGVLVATINYIYVELFNAKWMERIAHKFLPAKLDESQRKLGETERNMVELQRAMDEAKRILNEKSTKLTELETFKAGIIAELTCQHCSQVFKSYGSVQSHKSHCAMNPNSRKSGVKIMNGHTHEA